MKKVFLITKLRTTNVGNQALSEELVKLFVRELGADSLCVKGRPMGLDGYTPDRIKDSLDPVKLLEHWADSIITQFKGSKPSANSYQASINHVELIGVSQPKLKFENIKARLRPLKRFLSRFKSYNIAYQERLEAISSCDWLIYSGAGEVGDNNVFLRQLLEIRVAQKLGLKTAAVNQSVVIKTDPFKKLVGHVYGKMDKVVVRGQTSKANLLSYGVSDTIFTIAPDTALNTIIPNKEALKEDLIRATVGINFTPRVTLDMELLGKIIEAIRATGKHVIFLTNEPYEDGKVGDFIKRKFGIESSTRIGGYEEYSQSLGSLDYLISTRLHSNILALVAKTPVIPIEGNVFKTTELLKQLQYPIGVIDPESNGWMLRVLEEIKRLENGYYNWKEYFDIILPQHVSKVSDNASWLRKM